MDTREFSFGKIVDYMPGFPNPNVMAVCIWFEKAKVQPVTISETWLRAKEISTTIGTRIMAIIDTEARDEIFVNPTDISPVE
jgi:hypothetical protein